MITAALGFVTGNWQRLAIYAVVIASALGVTWMHGLFTGRAALHEYKAEVAVKRAEYITRVQTVVQEVRVPYVQREIQIQTRFVEIEKEAASVPSRPACNVTAGWMRQHNHAADPDRREPGALDDAADTGIGEADAAGVVSRNYRRYHSVANDLKACRAAFDGIGKVQP